MAYQVIIEAPAQEDIKAALEWMAQSSGRQATLWYDDLMEAIERLENFPRRCARAPENKYVKEEIRQLLFEKYRILFTIRDEYVHVLHVRHQAQRQLASDE
jgi:plasmid stabilization system protein ParE